jgi:hypothetical protein
MVGYANDISKGTLHDTPQLTCFFLQFGEEYEVFPKVEKISEVRTHSVLHIRTGVETRRDNTIWLQ